MSPSQSSKSTTSRTAKRARFAEREAQKGGASPVVLVLGLVVVLAIIGGIAFALSRPSPAVANSQDANSVGPIVPAVPDTSDVDFAARLTED